MRNDFLELEYDTTECITQLEREFQSNRRRGNDPESFEVDVRGGKNINQEASEQNIPRQFKILESLVEDLNSQKLSIWKRACEFFLRMINMVNYKSPLGVSVVVDYIKEFRMYSAMPLDPQDPLNVAFNELEEDLEKVIQWERRWREDRLHIDVLRREDFYRIRVDGAGSYTEEKRLTDTCIAFYLESYSFDDDDDQQHMLPVLGIDISCDAGSEIWEQRIALYEQLLKEEDEVVRLNAANLSSDPGFKKVPTIKEVIYAMKCLRRNAPDTTETTPHARNPEHEKYRPNIRAVDAIQFNCYQKFIEVMCLLDREEEDYAESLDVAFKNRLIPHVSKIDKKTNLSDWNYARDCQKRWDPNLQFGRRGETATIFPYYADDDQDAYSPISLHAAIEMQRHWSILRPNRQARGDGEYEATNPIIDPRLVEARVNLISKYQEMRPLVMEAYINDLRTRIYEKLKSFALVEELKKVPTREQCVDNPKTTLLTLNGFAREYQVPLYTRFYHRPLEDGETRERVQRTLPEYRNDQLQKIVNAIDQTHPRNLWERGFADSLRNDLRGPDVDMDDGPQDKAVLPERVELTTQELREDVAMDDGPQDKAVLPERVELTTRELSAEVCDPLVDANNIAGASSWSHISSITNGNCLFHSIIIALSTIDPNNKYRQAGEGGCNLLRKELVEFIRGQDITGYSSSARHRELTNNKRFQYFEYNPGRPDDPPGTFFKDAFIGGVYRAAFDRYRYLKNSGKIPSDAPEITASSSLKDTINAFLLQAQTPRSFSFGIEIDFMSCFLKRPICVYSAPGESAAGLQAARVMNGTYKFSRGILYGKEFSMLENESHNQGVIRLLYGSAGGTMDNSSSVLITSYEHYRPILHVNALDNAKKIARETAEPEDMLQLEKLFM